jgi:hypothetical protein
MLAVILTCGLQVLTLTSCVDSVDNPVTPVGPGEQTAFTTKQLPVNRYGEASGTVNVRFYNDMPSVPYISVADFQSLVKPGTTISVTKTGDGLYQLQNAGGSASVNTTSDTMAFDDYMAFTNLMDLLQPGMDNVYYDGGPFVRYNHQTLTGGSSAVTFDYGKYAIDLRGDDTAVYFPFTTLADLYADLSYHNAACNGEKVVVAKCDDDSWGIEALDPDFTAQSIMEAGTRTADMAAYSYGELCFVLDHFYGLPGRAIIERMNYQEGLDKFLASTADGQQVKQLLLSTDMTEYAYGLEMLNAIFSDGGHTALWAAESLISADGSTFEDTYPSLAELYNENYYSSLVEGGGVYYANKPLRSLLFGDLAGSGDEGDDDDDDDDDEEDNTPVVTYHKKGNTAICHFDSFNRINFEAWNKFYAGTGPLPTLENTENDDLVVFLDALKKADEDPEVKNLVIDLTLNTGGSLDVVVAMTSLMYGESLCRCFNVLTGQQMTWYYDVDRNFDGKFDDRDNDVHYDLNFCILASRLSFSCGNLFPSLCQDSGLLVVGEKSGGGSCAVGTYRTAEGLKYSISSARARLVNKLGQNIDGGVVPQVPIALGPDMTWQEFTVANFSNFYDIDNLSSIIGNR